MFSGCSSLKFLDVSNFPADKPKMQLDAMFKGCCSLQMLDLSSFDTGMAKSATDMFDGCSALQTIYVSDLFKIYGVTSSNRLARMAMRSLEPQATHSPSTHCLWMTARHTSSTKTAT